jgi:hypothetical protein
MIYHDLPMKTWLESPILCCYHKYHDLQFFLVLRNDLPIKHVIHNSHVSFPEGSRPRLSRFSAFHAQAAWALPRRRRQLGAGIVKEILWQLGMEMIQAANLG